VNVLKQEKQALILSALVEGNSMRSTARLCDVDRESVTKLLLRAGICPCAWDRPGSPDSRSTSPRARTPYERRWRCIAPTTITAARTSEDATAAPRLLTY